MSISQRIRNAVNALRQSPTREVVTARSSDRTIWAIDRRAENLSAKTREEIKKNPYVYAALRNTADEVVGSWNGAFGYTPADSSEMHLQRPPQIVAASDLSFHQQQADHLRWNIDYRLKRGWDAVLRALLHAREDGKSVLEIIWAWQPSGKHKGTWVIDDLLHCDPDAFNYTYHWRRNPQTGKQELQKRLNYHPYGGPGGRPVPPGKFVVYSFDRSYENDEGNSILNKLNLYDWYQRNNFVFWMVDLNRYGSPLLVGKVPKAAKQEQRDALFAAIESVQQETGIVLAEDEILEILQAQRNGAPGFELLNRIINAIIAVVITGNAMSLENTEKGSFALAKATTAEMRTVIFNSLATEIDNVINHQLIYWWMLYNYSATQEFPRHQLLAPRQQTGGGMQPATGQPSALAIPVSGVQFAERDAVPDTPEERLAKAAARMSADIMQKAWINPVLSMLRRFEIPEVKRQLERFASDMDEYAELMLRVLLTADLLGRWRVRQEIGAAESRKFADEFPDEQIEDLLSSPILLDMARELMLSKKLMSKADFEKLIDQKRRQAFTISGEQDARVQGIVKQIIAETIVNGITNKAELDQLARETFIRHGIAGQTPYHAETVFRTNIQSSLNDAFWRMLSQPENWREIAYFEYVTRDDNRVRPTHFKMHGIVRPPDDPIWQVWWPPNGYNCRCGIRIITRREADRRNIQPSPSIPKVFPDTGFSSGPSGWIS